MKRVVVTGIGLVSVLGHELDGVVESLRAGRSGIAIDPEREAVGFRSPLTGMLPPFDAKAMLNRKQRRTMGQAALYGAISALRAVGDADLQPSDLATPEAGVIVGNDSCAMPTVGAVEQVLADGGTHGLGSGWIIK